MKKFFAVFSSVFFLTIICLAQNQVNPASQVRWPAVTGAVDPAPPTWPCAPSNYGQPYTNTVSGNNFVCAAAGWVKVSSSGGGSGTVVATPQYLMFLQPNAGTQAVAQGAAVGQNGVAPMLQGTINPDLYATGGGNNGVANAFASSDCTVNCVVVRNAQSTDTEQSPVPPSGSTYGDQKTGNFVWIKHNPSLVPAINSAGQVCNNTNSAWCYFGVFDSPSPLAANPGNFSPIVGNYNAVFNNWGFNYGNAPGTNGVLWGGGGKLLQLTPTFNSQGISQVISGSAVKHATGDFASLYQYGFCDGGQPDSSGEGCTGHTMQTGETSDYFHGIVGAGATTGSVSLPITYNSGISTKNRNATTGGTFLVDLTQGSITGTFTGVSTLVSTYSVQSVPVSSTVTPSSTYGVLGCTLPIPVATNPNIQGTATCNVSSLLGSSAQFTTGHAYLAGQFPEEINITAAPAPSAGVQSITFSYLHPHGATVTSVWQGSNVMGNFISFDQNLAISGFREMLHVFGAIDSSHLAVELMPFSAPYSTYSAPQAITLLSKTGTTVTATFTGLQAFLPFNLLTSAVIAGCSDSSLNGTVSNVVVNALTFQMTWTQSGGGVSCPTATIQIPSSNFGFHLYPGAEILGPSISAPGNLPLQINDVAWTSGDLIEDPHHPFFSGSGLRNQMIINTQMGSSLGGITGYGFYSTGVGITGQYKQFNITNLNPCSMYAGCGGFLSPVPMINIGTGGGASPNSGIIVAAETPLPGFAAFNLGCPDATLGGCSNTQPQIAMQYGYANSNLYFYPDISSWGATNFVAGSTSARGLGNFSGGKYQINGYQNGAPNTGLYFDANGSSTTAIISLCQDFAGTNAITIGACNVTSGHVTIPDGRLDMAILNAQQTATIGSVVAGLTKSNVAPVPVYSGTAGATVRSYSFVTVSPLGIAGAVGFPSSSITTIATLDGSDFVTIPCPTALQPNVPAGTTYQVWQVMGTAYNLGTCALSGTVVDNAPVSGSTLPTRFGNNTSLAGQYQVEASGGLSFWSTNTTGGTLDTHINRLAANKIGIGSAVGSAHDGTLEAATGTFDTALTVAGQNVCQANGTNCPSSGISGLTTNTIPKATSSTAIGNSAISDNGTTVTSTEPIAAPSVSINSSQSLTGVQGTTGTKIAATTGSFTNGNLRSTDANGNEVDSAVAVSSVPLLNANNNFTGSTNTFSGGIVRLNLSNIEMLTSAATSGSPTVNSDFFNVHGSYWDGSVSQDSFWTLYNVMSGAGAGITSTFTFLPPSACPPGGCSVAVPAFQITKQVVNNVGLQVATGAGCTITAGAIGNTCAATLTLSVTESDTAYKVTGCSVTNPTGDTLVTTGGISSLSTTTFTISEIALSITNTGGGTINCTVAHN